MVGGSWQDPAAALRGGGMVGGPCSSDAPPLGRERAPTAARLPVGVEGLLRRALAPPAWGWPE
jgi:hypothetical protein